MEIAFPIHFELHLQHRQLSASPTLGATEGLVRLKPLGGAPVPRTRPQMGFIERNRKRNGWGCCYAALFSCLYVVYFAVNPHMDEAQV